MSNYLDVNYNRDEYGEDAYPQKLCDYIAARFFSADGKPGGRKLLDVGSGKGNHLVSFARRGIKVCGLDRRKECIGILDEFDVRECDIEKDPFPYAACEFDFVFSKSVIEHIRNTNGFLSESLRVLKPGGVAVFMTPDWRSQLAHFWDDYTHVKPFTRKSLQNAMVINGFGDVQCSYFVQLPAVWEHPWLTGVTQLLSLLPDAMKWKDAAESQFRPWVRFSKEKMLLGVGVKNSE